MEMQPVVLYVEDDAQSRRLMQMLFVRRMALEHVTILENSEDFANVIETLQPKPTVIFLDIHMQPIDGFEMLDILREREWSRELPIVALTASVMNEEVQRLRTAGFDGCLAKPIDLGTFPEILERILAGETVWRILG